MMSILIGRIRDSLVDSFAYTPIYFLGLVYCAAHLLVPMIGYIVPIDWRSITHYTNSYVGVSARTMYGQIYYGLVVEQMQRFDK